MQIRLLYLLQSLHTGSCIKCYVCSTTGNPCSEFDSSLSSSQSECPQASSSCMETRETVQNETIVTQRSCWSSKTEECLTGNGVETVCSCLSPLCNCGDDCHGEGDGDVLGMGQLRSGSTLHYHTY